MLEVSSPDYYYPFIIIFTLIFAVIEGILAMTTVKNHEHEDLDEEELLLIKDADFIQKGRQLKKKYLVVYLLSKSAMWAKAPYTFMLFSNYYNFTIPEIGLLYLIDAIFALLAGPFVGLVSDTFGRKFTSALYPLGNIITISLRLSGVVPFAYAAQVVTGIFGSILTTSFEAWLNYEITKLYGDQKNYVEVFRKRVFSRIMYYDSLLSIITTMIGAILFVNIIFN
jgi:MFS family permease